MHHLRSLGIISHAYPPRETQAVTQTGFIWLSPINVFHDSPLHHNPSRVGTTQGLSTHNPFYWLSHNPTIIKLNLHIQGRLYPRTYVTLPDVVNCVGSHARPIENLKDSMNSLGHSQMSAERRVIKLVKIIALNPWGSKYLLYFVRRGEIDNSITSQSKTANCRIVVEIRKINLHLNRGTKLHS
jgi:hypothetical protein